MCKPPTIHGNYQRWFWHSKSGQAIHQDSGSSKLGCFAVMEPTPQFKLTWLEIAKYHTLLSKLTQSDGYFKVLLEFISESKEGLLL